VKISVFTDFVRSYHSPFVASYCARNNFDNKCLLISDIAPGHPTNVGDYVITLKLFSCLPKYHLDPPTNGSICNTHFQGILFATGHENISESDSEIKIEIYRYVSISYLDMYRPRYIDICRPSYIDICI
jgi:hypothetical protein